MSAAERDGGLEAQEEAFVLVERTVSPYVVCFHQPQSLYAEQYRALRNKIAAMNRTGAARCILVSSAQAGDGKTVTLANLGLALGELERTRVLLIDADFRRPGLESLLGLSFQPGLADLLQGRIGLEEAIRDSGFPNVDLMGAGSRAPNPGGLLSSQRVRELLAALKERYRYTLLDSPPVLAVTDAATLGPVADGVLLVVRLERTPRPAVERALAALQGVGAAVLGVFLTGLKGAGPSDGDPYYSSRYSQGGEAVAP